jgi:hypothetical protein
MKTLIDFLLLMFDVLVGRGNWLGKDTLFGVRGTKESGPWIISEMGAADRNILIALVDALFKLEDKEQQAEDWMCIRMQALAICVRNKYGYRLYDPLNNEHLVALAQYPDSVLNEALKTVNDLCHMPWLVIPDVAVDQDSEDDDNDGTDINP